jgi:hypothetical protein
MPDAGRRARLHPPASTAVQTHPLPEAWRMKIVGLVLVIGIAIVVIAALPDIARYMKIWRM